MIEDCYKQLGLIIQRKRIHMGMTQEKFAKAHKINRVTLCNLELGKARIMLHDVVRIAKVLNLNLNGLIKNKPTPKGEHE